MITYGLVGFISPYGETMKFLSVLSILPILVFSLPCFSQAQKINIGDFDIEVEVLGSGENTVLFEAGMTRDLNDWDAVFYKVAKIAQVIRYSRVGNGNSSKTTQHFSAEQYARHTKKLLETLHITQPIIHVSHSYGGIIARTFAAQYPKKVKALMLIDPASEHDLDIMRAIDLTKAIAEIKWLKNRGVKDGMANEYLDYWTKRPMPNFSKIGDKPLTLIASVKKWDKPPILLMTDLGRVKMGEQHKAWAESFPQGKAILTENSYHYIQNEEPDLVINELKKLLARSD